MEMPPTSMYGDPHSRAALDTLAAHHAAAAQHMQNHSPRQDIQHHILNSLHQTYLGVVLIWRLYFLFDLISPPLK